MTDPSIPARIIGTLYPPEFHIVPSRAIDHHWALTTSSSLLERVTSGMVQDPSSRIRLNPDSGPDCH